MLLTEKLNLLMEKQGLTRGSLAEKTGIPYNTIVSLYSRGYHNMKLSTLQKLADFFGLGLDEFARDDRSLTPLQEAEPPMFARYRRLGSREKKLVDRLVEGLTGLHEEEVPVEAPKVRSIREYLTPAAAGYASPALGEDYILVPRTEDVPAAADFAVRIAGDSMEPWIQDGSRVYVTRTSDLTDGDVGIFFVDGDMKCKQFCQDSFGNVYLMSLNRDRADADVTITASSGVTVFCFGRVLLEKRPRLPKL